MIVVVLSFSCNLVQVHRPKPLIPLPVPINIGVIVLESTTNVPPNWYGTLVLRFIMLQVRFEWTPSPLVLDLQLSLVSTFDQITPISYHRCISVLFFNSLMMLLFLNFVAYRVISLVWMNYYRVYCLCFCMMIHIWLSTSLKQMSIFFQVLVYCHVLI